MKIRAILALTGLTIIGLATPVTAAQASTTATHRTVVYGDDGGLNFSDPDIRPVGPWDFGATGYQYITSMHWSSWGIKSARGTGTIHVCRITTCKAHHVSLLLYSRYGRNSGSVWYFRKLTLRWRGHVQRDSYSKHGGSDFYWN